MKAVIYLAAAVLLEMAAPAAAQGQCDRADLDHMVDSYLAAQTAGDALKLPLADFTSYTEQGNDASMSSGILSRPLQIAAHRTLIDLPTCQAFTEVVITDPAYPAVIGTRLQFSGRDNPIAPSRVNQIESVIVARGVGSPDARRALDAAKTEDWGAIPAASRDTRATLLQVANAYLDLLGDASAKPPLAPDCVLTEQGTKGPCTATRGSKATDRHFVVDEERGAVAAMASLGSEKVADVRLLRIEGGRIRFVHVLTAGK